MNKVAETAYMLDRDRFLMQVADEPRPADVALEDLLGEVSATFGAQDTAADAEVRDRS